MNKGKIMGAILTTHVPRLGLTGEERDKYIGAGGSTFFQALEQVYKERLKELEVQTFVIIDTHWWTVPDFFLDSRGRFTGVYTSDEAPRMISSRPYDFFGDSSLAEAIVAETEGTSLSGRVHALDDANIAMHYATLMPMWYLNPNGEQRVLRMSIAPYPGASVETELEYGKIIRAAVERLGRHVVIVASGGLSHRFPPFEAMWQRSSSITQNIDSRHRQIDEDIIRYLRNGEHSAVMAVVEEFRRRYSPEGCFAHYLRMLGTLSNGGTELACSKGIQYGEYEAALGTGQVILWFDV